MSHIDDFSNVFFLFLKLYHQLSRYCPLKGVMIVRERRSNRSFGFAFAEYDHVDAANHFLGLLFNNINPIHLMIDNRFISVSYAHLESFVPSSGSEDTMGLVYVDTVTANKVKFVYWDQEAYAVQYPPIQDGATVPEFRILMAEAFLAQIQPIVEPNVVESNPTNESQDDKLEEKQCKSIILDNCIFIKQPIAVFLIIYI